MQSEVWRDFHANGFLRCKNLKENNPWPKYIALLVSPIIFFYSIQMYLNNNFLKSIFIAC